MRPQQHPPVVRTSLYQVRTPPPEHSEARPLRWAFVFLGLPIVAVAFGRSSSPEVRRKPKQICDWGAFLVTVQEAMLGLNWLRCLSVRRCQHGPAPAWLLPRIEPLLNGIGGSSASARVDQISLRDASRVSLFPGKLIEGTPRALRMCLSPHDYNRRLLQRTLEELLRGHGAR